MSTTKVIIAGVVGGLVYMFVGFLIYGVIIKSFMMAHPGGAIVNRSDAGMMGQMLYMLAGNMAFGFLLAIIFGRWADIETVTGGLMAGAVVGLFSAGGFHNVMYATTFVYSRIGIAVDIAAFTVLSAIAGAVVAWILGMGKKA